MCTFNTWAIESIHSTVIYIQYNIYKPTVQPVASHSLFLDIHVVTLLLGKCSLFAHVNLYYPTTRLCSYFLHLCVYIHMMGCKKGFRYQCKMNNIMSD